MRVSIIIRNYNYAEFLRDALDSALAQTHQDTEVLVVDDGSTDGSREILAEYQSRCQVILQDNGGEGDAVNVGFARATGDIIHFLDSDDILAPNAISEVVSCWERDTTRVHFRLWTMDRKGNLFAYPLPSFEVPQLNLDEALFLYGQVPSAGQSSNAYAAWALRKILPLDAVMWRRAPDVYLNALTLAQGPSKLIQNPLGGYRQHTTSLTIQNSLNTERNGYVVMIHPNLFSTVRNFIGEARWSKSRSRYNSYHMLHRLISLRLNPTHPFKNDNLAGVALACAHSIAVRPNTRMVRRFLLLSGMLAACILPPPILRKFLPNLLRIARKTSSPRSLNSGPTSILPSGTMHWRTKYGVTLVTL